MATREQIEQMLDEQLPKFLSAHADSMKNSIKFYTKKAPGLLPLANIAGHGAATLTPRDISAIIALPKATVDIWPKPMIDEFVRDFLPAFNELKERRPLPLEEALTNFGCKYGDTVRGILSGPSSPKTFDVLSRVQAMLVELHPDRGFNNKLCAKEATFKDGYNVDPQKLAEFLTKTRKVEMLENLLGKFGEISADLRIKVKGDIADQLVPMMSYYKNTVLPAFNEEMVGMGAGAASARKP